jgi:hypothetical protein
MRRLPAQHKYTAHGTYSYNYRPAPGLLVAPDLICFAGVDLNAGNNIPSLSNAAAGPAGGLSAAIDLLNLFS